MPSFLQSAIVNEGPPYVISAAFELIAPSLSQDGIVTLTKYNRFRGRFGPIGTGASPCFRKGRSAQTGSIDK